LLRVEGKDGIWNINDYLTEAVGYWGRINDIRQRLNDEVRIAKDHGQKDVTLVDAYLYPERVKGTSGTLLEGDNPLLQRPKVTPITESQMRLMEKPSAEI